MRHAIPAELRAVADLAGGSCVTCSDTAVPATVVLLLAGGLALADAGAGPEEISVALVAARVGDTVLVHAGEAIRVLPEVAG
ncbi:HypC/HybG/HupF family hydrogenase formation chaperone [Catellatospora sp. NPDC049111]|jgi:hydrogenase maturation factor|uniref:HypC/HybG/HupF family hydrogenase formation chaperone n=1 Tax=Catellatospora aurea TaxID=1337874 RepID=A0ABW2GX80_9ACTN